ncbi:MAG: hypothetical protein ACYCO0_03475, partial [Candidatus Micrarchaeaceae archaeon]
MLVSPSNIIVILCWKEKNISICADFIILEVVLLYCSAIMVSIPNGIGIKVGDFVKIKKIKM